MLRHQDLFDQNTTTMSVDTLQLTEAHVAAYKKLLRAPGEHGLPFRPIEQCFKPSEVATPKHKLFESFQEEVPGCPKIIFYIIMDELYPNITDNAPSGELGYKLEFIKL